MTLPERWSEMKLEELGNWKGGGTPSKANLAFWTNGDIPWVSPKDMKRRLIDGAEDFITAEAIVASATNLVPEGSILIVTRSGILQRTLPVAETVKPVAINQDLKALTPHNGVLSSFVRYAFEAFGADILHECTKAGTTVDSIDFERLKARVLAVPPTVEQRRIVAKLDALTARLTRARAELDRVPMLIDSFRIAALRHVFHWKSNNLPAGWQRKRIDEIGSVQLGRQRSPKDHSGPHMRPYMRAANITWSGWDFSDVKEMNFNPAEYETFSLRPGDVLLNEGSGSAKEVGKPAVWHEEVEGACFQNTLLRIRPHTYSSELLRYSLLYVALSGQFIDQTKGVNIIHIGKAGLSKTIIPVPPVEEQSSLLEMLQSTFARADRLEAEAARARALLDRLEAAILAKAFRGELVPQDPNDEPASVLLERIRAQRAASSKAKPMRGRRAADSA